MITRNELKGYCSLTGFNLSQVERDYMQHLFLFFLSRMTSSNLVFKGGTALQKAYGLNRFSIDLDFTQLEETEFEELIGKIAKNMNDLGYPSMVKEIKTLGRTFILQIQGPLYNNTSVTICSLRIEISQKENILIKPIFREITPVYRDLQPYSILVMHPDEIFAEKIRAIMTRNKPRDIFDLHFLLKKGGKFNFEFINQKLEYYKEKFEKKKFIEKVKEKKPIWEREMKNYIAIVPDFDNIVEEITENVK